MQNIQINIVQQKADIVNHETIEALEKARDYFHALNLRLIDMLDDYKKENKAIKAELQALKKAVIKDKLKRLTKIENGDLRTSA